MAGLINLFINYVKVDLNLEFGFIQKGSSIEDLAMVDFRLIAGRQG